MRLIALEIPDDAAALAGWLEGHLVGLDLAALVAELEAVHGAARKPVSLDQLLGSRREAIRERGLAALPPDRLRFLLRQPRLLPDLQEWLLIEGGPYWQHLAADAAGREPRQAIERGWERLAAGLAGSGDAGPRAAPFRPDAAVASSVRRSSGRRWRWLGTLAAAAAVLVALVLAVRGPGPDGRGQPGPVAVASKGWGWDRPGALPEDLSREAYLNHLADAAHEWFNQRPDTPLALARRIAEFREGCSVLILSPHRPLPDEDRVWLVEKCRAWAAKLDAHLATVEAGQDVLKVRGEVDATINRLIDTLHERAATAV
jgi:hypothetical protein